MKSWLEKNATEMYSTHNERKSVIVERFIRILENKIYKYMTSISKKVYINKLDDIVTKYNNTYHSTIKMKPVDVKSSTYIDSSKEINNKDPKFKIYDVPNWSEEVSVIKNTVSWIYVVCDLKGEEIIGTFYEKKFENTSKRV